jgi:hypothetical protein
VVNIMPQNWFGWFEEERSPNPAEIQTPDHPAHSLITTLHCHSSQVDKTEFINYQGISLLSSAKKKLTNILLSRLTPYAHKIIWGSLVLLLM